MTRIVPVFYAFLLAGCQQPLKSHSASLHSSKPYDWTLPSGVVGPDRISELKFGSKCSVTLADSSWGENSPRDQTSPRSGGSRSRMMTGTVASTDDGILVLSDAEEVIRGPSQIGIPATPNQQHGVIRRQLGTVKLSTRQIRVVRVDEW